MVSQHIGRHSRLDKRIASKTDKRMVACYRTDEPDERMMAVAEQAKMMVGMIQQHNEHKVKQTKQVGRSLQFEMLKQSDDQIRKAKKRNCLKANDCDAIASTAECSLRHRFLCSSSTLNACFFRCRMVVIEI